MGGIFILILLPALFGATCLIEAVVVSAFGERGRRRLLVETSLALNLLTWPLAAECAPGQSLGLLVLLELGLVIVEAAGYAIVAGLQFKRALVVSLVANAASFLGGLAVYWTWFALLSA